MFKKKRKGKINDKVLLVSSRPPTDLQLCEAGWGTSLSHASHFRLQHPQTAPKRLNVQVCSGKTGISSSWRKEESRTDGVPRPEDQLSCALNCGAPPPPRREKDGQEEVKEREAGQPWGWQQRLYHQMESPGRCQGLSQVWGLPFLPTSPTHSHATHPTPAKPKGRPFSEFPTGESFTFSLRSNASTSLWGHNIVVGQQGSNPSPDTCWLLASVTFPEPWLPNL